MTDLKELRCVIDDSGIPISTLARKMNIGRESLYNKINGKTEFKISEMDSISKALNLNESQKSHIFFAE